MRYIKEFAEIRDRDGEIIPKENKEKLYDISDYLIEIFDKYRLVETNRYEIVDRGNMWFIDSEDITITLDSEIYHNFVKDLELMVESIEKRSGFKIKIIKDDKYGYLYIFLNKIHTI